jgi:hypothetical protein
MGIGEEECPRDDAASSGAVGYYLSPAIKPTMMGK